MPTVTRLDGWYEEEHDGVRPYRWIGHEASGRITDLNGIGPFYLQMVAARSLGAEPCRLSLSVNGRVAGERDVPLNAVRYLFPLEGSGDVDIKLSVDSVRTVAGDSRALGLSIYSLDVVDVGQLTEPVYGDGWYEGDDADYFSSRWMGVKATLLVPPRFWHGRFAALPACSGMEPGEQVLTLHAGGHAIAELPLLPRWHIYDFMLPAAVANGDRGAAVTMRVNRAQPGHLHPSDPRELGIRVGTWEVHDDARRWEKTRALHDLCRSFAVEGSVQNEDEPLDAEHEEEERRVVEQNAVVNQREFESGATVLTSFAPNLGIDLYGKCNMKPPCVYCQWDVGKALEGQDAEAVVDDQTFVDYGPFFSAASVLVNCSIGEPLLHPRLPQVLDMLARHHKEFQVATNGQAFTPSTVRALAGRHIVLCVSLDAASGKTYARLRNDRWPDVLAGLFALREARLHGADLPRVWIVFMPMKANVQDLEACFKLCRIVHAETLVLRPLIRFEHTDIAVDRAGYHFDYARELLTQSEIERVGEQANEFAEKYSIRVENQLGFRGASTT